MTALSWPRLAIAAAVTIILLVARVIVGRPLVRRAAAPVNWLGETPERELQRRVAACEANLGNVWEVLNGGNASDR